MRTLILFMILIGSLPALAQTKIEPLMVGGSLTLLENGQIAVKADPEYPARITTLSKEPIDFLAWGKHTPRRIEQHSSGRWFGVIYDDKILMSLPAQRNVDTIWYEIKEVRRTRGRITLK